MTCKGRDSSEPELLNLWALTLWALILWALTLWALTLWALAYIPESTFPFHNK